jgi:hypothetical protein
VERKFSSYTCLTLALDGGEWSALVPGRTLTPGKGPLYPLNRGVGGSRIWSVGRGYRNIGYKPEVTDRQK